MKTRNGDTAKSTATKKTPPKRKTPAALATPRTLETKCGSRGRGKQAKTNEATPPQVEEAKPWADDGVVTPVKKAVASSSRSGGKKKLVKIRTSPSRKAILIRTPNSQEAQKTRAEESPKGEVEDAKKEELANENVRESPMLEQSTMEGEEPMVENVAEETKEEDTAFEDPDESVKEDQTSMEIAKFSEDKESNRKMNEQVGDSVKRKEPSDVGVVKFSENKSSFQKKGEEEDSVNQMEHVAMEVAKPNDNVDAIFQYKEEEADEDPEEELENVDDNEEPMAVNVAEGKIKEDIALEDVDGSVKQDPTSMEVAKSSEDKVSNYDKKELVGDSVKQKEPSVVGVVKFSENESSFRKRGEGEDFVKPREHVVMEVSKPNDNVYARFQYKDEEANEDPEEELENVDDKEEPEIVPIDKEENMKSELLGENVQSELDDNGSYEEYGDRVDYGEHEEEEFDDGDMEEPVEETETLEDERRELNAIAKDRRTKKEHEIFIGGLDHDATEEDVRKVFERIGEIVEVRLHKNFSSTRNKGYAFVMFANKEHAKRALSEMKNPVICGKRCGTAPSEDNDTLFVGNICNTWTKEAINQKLKDYGVEGVENINLVPDIQHYGFSRGFAFIVFSCHVDAMAAYKRLQKPDVVFGHSERTVKVAFAEPLREPDPEIMAHVKTVFLDGVPPHWNENQISERIKGYGEIVRIVLARNMSSAKRKDYGFIDFATHEAAVACINGINNKDFSDGNSKLKLRARLSNPMPKTQAVKGGMSGGFRIGHGGNGTFSRFRRGFGRGGRHFNWANFQRGRGFYQHGRGHISRMGSNDYGIDERYTDFHGRQFVGRGGRRGSFRGGYHAPGAAAAAGPSRPNPTRLWPGPDRRYGEHHSYRRQPFSPCEGFERPFIRRQVDDPYFYDDRSYGVKRPFHAMDHEPDYMGPNRFRPRMDYNVPAIPFHGSSSSHCENFGPGSDPYSDDYHVSDYGAYPPYPPYYGDDHAYGGGYFY